MTRWKILSLILPLAVLAACATPAERAEQAQKEMDEMMRVYGPACEKLGFVHGDDKWRDCVLDLAAKDDRRRGRTTFSACVGSYSVLGCGTF
jgi:hypothetical protein